MAMCSEPYRDGKMTSANHLVVDGEWMGELADRIAKHEEIVTDSKADSNLTITADVLMQKHDLVPSEERMLRNCCLQISSADPENENSDRAEQAAEKLYSEVAGDHALSRQIDKKRGRAARKGAGHTRPAKYSELLEAKTPSAGARHSRGAGKRKSKDEGAPTPRGKRCRRGT